MTCVMYGKLRQVSFLINGAAGARKPGVDDFINCDIIE